MKVRVWINGAEGSSHDFELLDAPRVGDRVHISVGDQAEEGTVASVTWQLYALDGAAGGSLEGEPAGSVTIVHVVCTPPKATEAQAVESVGLREPAGA